MNIPKVPSSNSLNAVLCGSHLKLQKLAKGQYDKREEAKWHWNWMGILLKGQKTCISVDICNYEFALSLYILFEYFAWPLFMLSKCFLRFDRTTQSSLSVVWSPDMPGSHGSPISSVSSKWWRSPTTCLLLIPILSIFDWYWVPIVFFFAENNKQRFLIPFHWFQNRSRP